MLNEHLIAKTRPQANASNFVFWKDYRVTVLGDRLFRVEKNGKKRFRDGATQSVWFRDMPAQKFSVQKGKDETRIVTQACALVLKPRRKDCYVLLDGKKIAVDNTGNLLGTYRTLDVCDGGRFVGAEYTDEPPHNVRLGGGVCSTTGVAYFADAQSLTLGADGEIKPEKGQGKDEYVFVYGDDYRGALRALYQITGATPLLPRFAFGNWWSRYYAYTDEEYLRLLQRFADREIPLSVAVIDMDWHYVDMESAKQVTLRGRNTDFYGGNDGWTGYTWNTELFPDYRAFLQEIEERELKISLNLHPARGFRWWEDCYADMAAAMGIDPETGKHVEFDFTDPTFINAYFEKAHNPLEADGVGFWWIDWQQGTTSRLAGLDPLWSLNHYHYLDGAREGEIPLILSRFAGVGSHRYPVGFSGDTLVTWKTLAYLPYFTATASNVGYTWWSHDIGGHMQGVTDGELYLRHVQYGVFSPINRLHCSNMQTMTKEPWYYTGGTGKIAEEFLRLRHALVPYLYACNQRTHAEGLPLVEPLYYEWKNEEAYRYAEEYLFGGELLVAPVTEPCKKDGFAYVKAWLPEGKWTDIFTGDEYEIGQGGEEKTLMRTLESIPVLARAGAVLPLSQDKGNGCGNPKRLKARIFNGDGAFTLYEDDGKLNGKKATTVFQTAYAEADGFATQTVEIVCKGNAGVIPKNRLLTLEFANVRKGEATVFVGGEEIAVKPNVADRLSLTLPVRLKDKIRVEVRFYKESKLDREKARAREILTYAEGNNEDKYFRGYNPVQGAKTLEEYLSAVNNASVSNATKKRILETM